jgi:hypothetical protein
VVVCSICLAKVAAGETVGFETRRDQYLVCLPCARDVGLAPAPPVSPEDHLPTPPSRRILRRRNATA